MAVQAEKLLDGRFYVGRYCDTKAEAQKVVDVLLDISSDAYRAVSAMTRESQARGEYAPPLTPEQEARFDAANPPDPIDVLNVDTVRSYEDGRE